MNILHISTASGWRGGERQIANLINGLNANYSKDVTNIVFCRDNEEFHQYCQKENNKHFTYQNSFNKLKSAKQIKTICQQQQIDIVHCHDSNAHTLAILAADFYKNLPPIIVHRRVSFLNHGWLSRYKYNHKKIVAYIPISKDIRQVLSKIVTEKNQSKIKLIYSSIQIDRIKNSSSINLKQNLNLSPRSKLIGNISALSDSKDFETFFLIAEQLVKESNDYHFIIVGDGEKREDLKQLVKEKNIQENVHFLGFQPRAIQYLKGFDCLLMTSKIEGLGTAVLEAFAAKIPVVSTNAGGLKEIAIHRQTALTAQVGDVKHLKKNCIEIFQNQHLRETLTKNAYQFVQENFVTEKMVNDTVALYREIL